MEKLSTDIFVLGSGIAGLRAALEARRGGAKVILLSKGPIGKKSSSFYAGGSLGGLNNPLPESVKKIINFKNELVNCLYEPAILERLAGRLKDETRVLSNLGIPLEIEGGQYHPRHNWKGPGGGATIVTLLARKTREAGVITLGNSVAAELLIEEGQVKGALCLNESATPLLITAKATVLATGGGAGLFRHNSTPEGIRGDGYCLALKAGALLKNMEFIHFYPVGLVDSFFPHRRVSPTILRLPGAKLVNSKGEDIVQKHLKLDLQDVVSFPAIRFQILPRLVALEARQGGAFVDLLSMPSSQWDRVLSQNWNRIFFKKAPVNLREKRCPVIPLAHTFMGGVKINIRGETALPGLYAAGEVAGGIYSNETWISQLGRCLVLGAIAGENALAFSRLRKASTVKEWEVQEILNRFLSPLSAKGQKRRPAFLRSKIEKLVQDFLGPLRNETSLRSGLEELESLEADISSMKVENMSQLKAALDVQNMFLLTRAILGSAYRRNESRGAHFREDFPLRDDKNWFASLTINFKEEKLNFIKEEIQPNHGVK